MPAMYAPRIIRKRRAIREQRVTVVVGPLGK